MTTVAGGGIAPLEPCVFCRGRDLRVDCGISLRGKLDAKVARCNHCGLLAVNPMPSPEQIASLYDSGYWDPDPPGQGVIEAYRRYPRHYRFGAAYGRRLARLAPSGRMLEIGCGLPFFLKGVADHSGWDVEGVDVSSGIADFARTKLGLKVTEAIFAGETFPPESFDLVRAKDVIEHVPRPVEFLAGIHRVLEPGGRIELWLPNGPFDLLLPRREWRRGRRVEMGAGHILFISPRVMAAMLKAAGFRVERHTVSGIRYALKALGLLGSGRADLEPVGQERVSSPLERDSGDGDSGRRHAPALQDWQPPARERGLKGTTAYSTYREWRSHSPALPVWLPWGFRQWVMGRKA